MTSAVQPIEWNGRSLRLLDQRALPDREDYVRCSSPEAVASAIRNMTVRGAPAIGIAAAYGLAMGVLNDGPAGFDGVIALLAASRPTAVNLRWALARMRDVWYAKQDSGALVAEAERIHREDLAQNLTMGELGAQLITVGAQVLTHCNTGALATGGHGTALGVIRTAYAQGRLRGIFHTETRPWMQGSRLTAWELQKDQIPARMIADGAAAHLMRVERIDWVIVGADRIAANGDTANKIGTYALAVAAARHGARFMVVAPSGTFDLECADGDHIPIEERGAAELTELGGRRIAPKDIGVFNPVFDVTPAELIDAIVCERGVIENPDAAKLRALLGS